MSLELFNLWNLFNPIQTGGGAFEVRAIFEAV